MEYCTFAPTASNSRRLSTLSLGEGTWNIALHTPLRGPMEVEKPSSQSRMMMSIDVGQVLFEPPPHFEVLFNPFPRFIEGEVHHVEVGFEFESELFAAIFCVVEFFRSLEVEWAVGADGSADRYRHAWPFCFAACRATYRGSWYVGECHISRREVRWLKSLGSIQRVVTMTISFSISRKVAWYCTCIFLKHRDLE